MATLSQIEANRRNAQHSTGPRTVEGKAASSMNALKSGIDAQSPVIPGEDAAALTALAERLYQDCRPQTVIESLLVDDIVRDTWLLIRLARIDAEILIHNIEDTKYPSPNAPAGKAFVNSSSTQSRLQRRINDTRRLRLQSIKELKLLQTQRPQQPVESESPETPIGFVPQPPDAPAFESEPPLPRASGPWHPAPSCPRLPPASGTT